ncbi:MAG: lipid-A-disaccharide synthase [Hapalosiphonaceae cyanobacterium JJU2]|nr:MAG: lipid-A-disaccharide synthase [Hapalosiphonaceae cyanobacterium JJU2]
MNSLANRDRIDILILSNAPGEVMTWVRPVVKALRKVLPSPSVRISVVLSPCPHASGQEAAILQSFPEVDRVQSEEGFWSFLLLRKTLESWDWSRQGVVLFLGGEQFFAIMIGKRLGYGIVTYAEWQARWLPWIDRCGLAQANLLQQIPQRFQSKVSVVGDLISEAQVLEPQQNIRETLALSDSQELIAILPGSKAAKLMMGVPLGLAIADYFQQHRPQVQCIFPLAPTLSLQDLEHYTDPDQNSAFTAVKGSKATLVQPSEGLPCFITEQGSRILLWQESPPYSLLSQCQLAITTVGANTAELTALAVPMLVLLPTQILEIMRAWDGIPGLLANAPVLSTFFARAFNTWMLRQGLGFRAWPNIWAKREIVPELVGHLYAKEVGEVAISLLQDPDRLNLMREELRHLRGQGAALRMAELVQFTIRERSGSI